MGVFYELSRFVFIKYSLDNGMFNREIIEANINIAPRQIDSTLPIPKDYINDCVYTLSWFPIYIQLLPLFVPFSLLIMGILGNIKIKRGILLFPPFWYQNLAEVKIHLVCLH